MRRFDMLVPACRVGCVRDILSMSALLGEDHRVVIHSSIPSNTSVMVAECEEYSHAVCIGSDKMVGPAEARSNLQDYFLGDPQGAPTALYIDEDVRFDSKVLKLVDSIEKKVGDIVGGWWTEEGSTLEVGQLWVRGMDSTGRKTIFKRFIQPEDLEVKQHAFIEVDQTMPVFAVSREVLEEIAWCKDYIHFFDHWDFFMQAKAKNYKSVVCTSVVTRHDPLPYHGLKDEYSDHVVLDSMTFCERWGTMPIGNLSNRKCLQS